MTDGALSIIVPVKGGPAVKSRLAGVLSLAERNRLALAMARHVIETACRFVGPAAVIVVTSSPAAAEFARAAGGQVLIDDDNAGTAAACIRAARYVTPDATTLFLNADLPLLDEAALRRLSQIRDRVVILPDRKLVGTNGLLLPPACPMAPCFGPDSFARHVAAAVATRAPITVFDDVATATDIDEPADLAEIEACRGRFWMRDVEHA